MRDRNVHPEQANEVSASKDYQLRDSPFDAWRKKTAPLAQGEHALLNLNARARRTS
jgi:hypothetical protein